MCVCACGIGSWRAHSTQSNHYINPTMYTHARAKIPTGLALYVPSTAVVLSEDVPSFFPFLGLLLAGTAGPSSELWVVVSSGGGTGEG